MYLQKLNRFLSGQASESIATGILLAMTGGFLETYSFISREQVFANCQTGNLVLLATNAVQGNLHKTIIYLTPVLTFMVGVFFTEYIKHRFREHPKIHWRQILVLVEVFLLLITGLIPSGPYNIVATTIIALSCALQYDSFRKIRGYVCATTMCTGNLRSLTENLFKCCISSDSAARKKLIHYILIVGFFMVGAIGGSITTRIIGERAVWICSFVLLVVFIMMFIRNEALDSTQ